MRLLAVVMVWSALALAGDSPVFAQTWQKLPASGSACSDTELSFDYGAEGGMRNFYCRALQVLSYSEFLERAPVAPFLRGPHQAKALVLDDPTSFGHYDPRFVRWAVDTLVPAAVDPALRAQTQPMYNAQVRTLARTFYEVRRALAANPGWVEAEQNRYLKEVKAGTGGWDSRVVYLYHDVLGPSESNWGGHDPNLVRSATMWWLRRAADGTAELWVPGLEKLLSTYDAKWLSAMKRRSPPKLPKRDFIDSKR